MSQKDSGYYSSIEKVKVLTDPESVNKHLQEGWVLLKIGETTMTKKEEDGVNYYGTALSFVIGKRVEAATPTPPPSPPPSPPPPPPRPSPAQTPPGKKLQTCTFCPAQIYLEQREGRWLPFNPDGSPHYCRKG